MMRMHIDTSLPDRTIDESRLASEFQKQRSTNFEPLNLWKVRSGRVMTQPETRQRCLKKSTWLEFHVWIKCKTPPVSALGTLYLKAEKTKNVRLFHTFTSTSLSKGLQMTKPAGKESCCGFRKRALICIPHGKFEKRQRMFFLVFTFVLVTMSRINGHIFFPLVFWHVY